MQYSSGGGGTDEDNSLILITSVSLAVKAGDDAHTTPVLNLSAEEDPCVGFRLCLAPEHQPTQQGNLRFSPRFISCHLSSQRPLRRRPASPLWRRSAPREVLMFTLWKPESTVVTSKGNKLRLYFVAIYCVASCLPYVKCKFNA